MDHDLGVKLKIAKTIFPGVLVIHENLCSRKFLAIRYLENCQDGVKVDCIKRLVWGHH